MHLKECTRSELTQPQLCLFLQSLIVKDRCKLELWDQRDGLERGDAPDLVFDRTPWWNLLGDKYVNELDDDHEDMNEAISAYRCSCRESMWG